MRRGAALPPGVYACVKGAEEGAQNSSDARLGMSSALTAIHSKDRSYVVSCHRPWYVKHAACNIDNLHMRVLQGMAKTVVR